MSGGRLDPNLCTSEGKRRELWQKLYRQKCPRTHLGAENVIAARVAMMLMNEEAPLAAAYIQDAVADSAARRIVLDRVAWARGSDRVRRAQEGMMREMRLKARRESEN